MRAKYGKEAFDKEGPGPQLYMVDFAKKSNLNKTIWQYDETIGRHQTSCTGVVNKAGAKGGTMLTSLDGSPGKRDGEYTVCYLDALDYPECLVYSIGANNMYAFEDTLLVKTGCQVHTFDCTKPYERKSTNRHTLHLTCLGDKGSVAGKLSAEVNALGGKIEVLEDVMKELRHTHVDLLKIDIEGFEYSVLADWKPEIFQRYPALRGHNGAALAPTSVQLFPSIHHSGAIFVRPQDAGFGLSCLLQRLGQWR